MKNSDNPIFGYLSYALAAAHRRVNLSLSTRLAEHGISIEAWRVLEVLDNGQRLTMGRLAELVLMPPPTLSKLVDRMVSEGLVHRQIARKDNRKINVLPTALGAKRMIQIRAEIAEKDEAIVKRLGSTDTESVFRILRELV